MMVLLWYRYRDGDDCMASAGDLTSYEWEGIGDRHDQDM